MVHPAGRYQTGPVRPGRISFAMWSDKFEQVEQPVIVATEGDTLDIYAEEFKRVVYLV